MQRRPSEEHLLDVPLGRGCCTAITADKKPEGKNRKNGAYDKAGSGTVKYWNNIAAHRGECQCVAAHVVRSNSE